MSTLAIANINEDYIYRRKTSAESWIIRYTEHLRDLTSQRRQQFFASRATHYFDLGGCLYVLNQLEECIASYSKAVEDWIEVFRLHGTSLIEVETNGRKYNLVDYSLSNSRVCRRAIYCAIISRDLNRALELANNDRTQVDYSFVSQDSTLCTEDDIKIVKSLKVALGSVGREAIVELGTAASRLDKLELQLHEDFAGNDSKSFESHCYEFLEFHKSMRQVEPYRNDTRYFVCLPVAAIVSLAESRWGELQLTENTNYETLSIVRFSRCRPWAKPSSN